MRHFVPPMRWAPGPRPSVFLAGSIDMGVAPDWQAELARGLEDLDVDVLNPRRPDWDATWRATFDQPEFREQVEWELAGLEGATLVAMYLAPETKAPISLLELGLVARREGLVVCCPEGYWRKGNVDVVCARYGIPQVPELAALLGWLRDELGS
ncbi:MAG: nucleoside 2-deoxyribosyltransferase domain-containing protein [Myxococcota bacterium]